MKFILETELGNEAMQSYDDIRQAVWRAALSGNTWETQHTPTVGDNGDIRDINGQTVGNWGVINDDEDAQVEAMAGLLWDYLKRDTEHKDRRQTGFGTKTKTGLLRSIKSILEHRR